MADEPRRKRPRRFRFEEDLPDRVERFVQQDEANRSEEMFKRLQRYAKYRMWASDDVTDPWPDAANAALSDLFTVSQRTQDTIYNAILSARPVMQARATDLKDRDKQDTIDKTLDHQLIVENGATWIDDLVEAFANDGHFTVFMPWVRDWRTGVRVRLAEPIPPEAMPMEYFVQLMRVEFPDAVGLEPRTGAKEGDVWDWVVLRQNGETVDVSFYTGEEDRLEMTVKERKLAFDGPFIRVLDRSDVLTPAAVANLQPPGPANPLGSPHVIVVDRPTIGEIETAYLSGRYDRLSKADIDELKAQDNFDGENVETKQKAIIEGASVEGPQPDEAGDKGQAAQKRVTRYLVFDTFRRDEKSPPEQVVYTVLKEARKLCRFRTLNEDFPSSSFSRPFAEAQFIPVKGRRVGIGVLEIAETTHDLKKQAFDMGFNHGTLLLSPWFFYRPTSSMKPEVIRINPGEGYPLSDPMNDVNFPRLPTEGQAFAINAYTLLDQDQEKATMIGDLQLGRVPRGKASALRTRGGMAMIGAQGESRPERILRRLFGGLGQIWAMAHDLNRHFLRDEKRIRIALPLGAHEDPYKTVKHDDIDTVVEFEFAANAFNISRTALQEALGQIGQFMFSPIAIQSGTVTPDRIYEWGKKWVRSWGQDPEEFIEPPSGTSRVTAKEAILSIMDNQYPLGTPLENPIRHLEALQRFYASDLFGHLTPTQVQLFKKWVQDVQQLAMMLLQRQQQMAGGGGPQQGQGGQDQGAATQSEGQAPVEANEMMDETMPSAGGGANTGVM